MTAAIIFLNTILGALWRRTLGGWDGPFKWALGTWLEPYLWDKDDGQPRRSVIMASGALLAWPLWFAWPWWGAILGTGLCLLFFAFGHRFDKGSIIFRYPWIGVAYRVAERYWPAKWNGPASSFIRDWTSPAELAIGGLFWGAIAWGSL